MVKIARVQLCQNRTWSDLTSEKTKYGSKIPLWLLAAGLGLQV